MEKQKKPKKIKNDMPQEEVHEDNAPLSGLRNNFDSPHLSPQDNPQQQHYLERFRDDDFDITPYTAENLPPKH